MENKLEDNIEISVYVASEVYIKVHSFDNGHEEEIEVNNIDSITFTDYFSKYGESERTCISYDTGWDDCPTDHIYVKESIEEVKALYSKAFEKKREISKKYAVFPKDIINKVCDYLKTYRRDIEDGAGYIAGIIDDKTIEDVRKLMEE